MLLNASGFIPSDPRFRNVCPSSEVVARWGRKTGPGYAFREIDGEEYHLYVEELFCRVHQRAMVSRILPLHFARGLLEESRGGNVNWASFAMIRCFPAHKRTAFEPWPEYAEVRDPLPWTHPKVLPLPPTVPANAYWRNEPEVFFKEMRRTYSGKMVTYSVLAYAAFVGTAYC